MTEEEQEMPTVFNAVYNAVHNLFYNRVAGGVRATTDATNRVPAGPWRVGLLTVLAGISAVAGCASISSDGSAENRGPRSFQPVNLRAMTTVATPPTPIDLSAPGAVVAGSAEVRIIDTRTFPVQKQITGPWRGEVRDIEEMLGEHDQGEKRELKRGIPNDLVAGELDETMIRTAPGQHFPGISATRWTPPDPTIAVGPNHIVTTVNTAIAFYQKDGTLDFSANLDDSGDPGFFEEVGGKTFCFDPKCFYDHLAKRFVVVALEFYGTTESWIDIAVSDDSDPNGVWYKYRTNSVVADGPNTFWVDYPGFGYDGGAYYVTGNLFGLNNGGFGGVIYRIFNKTPLLTGSAASFKDLRDANGASCQVAQHFGVTTTPYFVETLNNSALKVSAIKTPLGTTPTRVSTNVAVPAYSDGTGAPNKGGGVLDTVGDRLFNVHWRNGNLYTAHTVRVNNKDIARWYHMNTGTWPTSGGVTLVQSGNINPTSPPGQHTFFPAIYSDKNNAVGVVIGASTSTTVPSIRVAGRSATDSLGKLSALVTVKAGTIGANGRWGDYFDLAIDPNDDQTLWFIGEIQLGETPETSYWATEIGTFALRCPGDFNADGFVNGDDYDAFVIAFEAGSILADFNSDGFVNGDDFDGYAAAFEAGC